eukprot:a883645_9.p1 GENE.a883645_9~~a883645_9.p1  ORF type:complete len:314 (-),score=102.55 a883645_9:116-1021(-)
MATAPPKPYVYNPNKPKQPLGHYVLAGGSAGIVEILCMYPLDVVKTRMQLQSKAAGSAMYTSMVDCLRKIVAQEGFGTLYRGIISPILAEAPKRAAKFAFNEYYKQLFTGVVPQWSVAVAAGTMAGVSETFINCPFEVVKVRMQKVGSPYKSTADALVTIMRQEGPLALYNGVVPQVWRNGVWNGIYFALIKECKALFPTPTTLNQEHTYAFLSGSIAGTVATLANTPFDCAKSVMQAIPKDQQTLGVFGILRSIHATEGIPGLWKGIGPRLVRLGPGGGIMVLAFEVVTELLNKISGTEA